MRPHRALIMAWAVALTCHAPVRGQATHAAEMLPPFNVEPLVLKSDRVRTELAGRTLVNQGFWPFRIYIGDAGRYLGIWATDEQGGKTVRVDGRWAVKGDQICIIDDGRDKEICRFIALIGERILIFDENGRLAYHDVVRVSGNQLTAPAAGANRTH